MLGPKQTRDNGGIVCELLHRVVFPTRPKEDMERDRPPDGTPPLLRASYYAIGLVMPLDFEGGALHRHFT